MIIWLSINHYQYFAQFNKDLKKNISFENNFSYFFAHYKVISDLDLNCFYLKQLWEDINFFP